MLPGTNTDILHRGKTYHVQTEDKGREEALIETLIFEGGKILGVQRYSYQSLAGEAYEPMKVAKVMEQQHREMIRSIKTGRFDGKHEEPLHEQPEAEPPGEGGCDPAAPPQKEGQEVLSLRFMDRPLFTAGRRHAFTLQAQNRQTAAPVEDVTIKISLVSTFSQPQQLWEGHTGENGEVDVDCAIPPFTTGHAAVIIRASSNVGEGQLEQLVKKG